MNEFSTYEGVDIYPSKKMESDDEYLTTSKDDCPLYIFNSGFREVKYLRLVCL